MLLKILIFAIFCIISINCNYIIGAPSKLKDDDLKMVETLLGESLGLLKEQKDGIELNLVRISSGTVQIVSGVKYDIFAELENVKEKTKKTCKISIWHQSWIDFHETRFNCDDSTKYKVTKMGKRSKRNASKTIFGSPIDVEPEIIEELRQNISESFTQLASEHAKPFQLIEILGAQKQVVSGILYTVDTVIDLGNDNGTENCKTEVWIKPWIGFRQISLKCENGEKYKVVKDNRPKRSYDNLLQPLISIDEQQYNVNNFDPYSIESQFELFKQQFQRNYENVEEEAKRFRIFQNNLYLIRQLNKFEQGTATYEITEFTDLTQEEYFQRTGLLRNNLNDEDDNAIRNPFAEIPDIKLPKSHDWRNFNAVTPVKNQGSCGSCWAFSVTGNIEGLNAIKSGKLKSFSEQELVDCDDLDSGCGGGLPDNAVKFIEKEGGLETETDYPYTAHKSKSCKFNASLSRVQVSGVVDFKEGDEDGIAKWLTVNGPISIGINANAMQFYRGGISRPWKALCRPSSLDHGVLIVGFGVAEYPKFNKTIPYWIIKNSWGPRWGEQGYYRVYRGDNTCGVSSMASSAVLAKSTNY